MKELYVGSQLLAEHNPDTHNLMIWQTGNTFMGKFCSPKGIRAELIRYAQEHEVKTISISMPRGHFDADLDQFFGPDCRTATERNETQYFLLEWKFRKSPRGDKPRYGKGERIQLDKAA